MTLRLSGGVRPAPGRRIWTAGPALDAADVTDAEPAPGTPVAIGPRSADPTSALRALAVLIRSAGPVAAGAGVDLGDGFRSARVDGGAGDRRDAVLAALAAGYGERIGAPRVLLAAVFGPDATRPLGAAARAAIAEERWAALRFASAVSDLLGPEQLVDLLARPAPAGVDPFVEGLPSVVGIHLGRVLGPLPRPRRLTLLTDLWHQVCAYGAGRRRRERLLAAQGRADRTGDLTARYERYAQDELLDRLRIELGGEPTLVRAALWHPSEFYYRIVGTRVLRDAFAATVLARLAVAAVDDGIDAALDRHRPELDAVAREMLQTEAAQSARVYAGLTGLPARPGSYVRDLARLSPGAYDDRKRAQYVTQRLARARDYGRVAIDAVQDLLSHEGARGHLAGWANNRLTEWRQRVGYLSPDRLGAWDQPPLAGGEPLADRLRAAPSRPPAEIETVGDLFWVGELADALAQLNGHPAAVIHARADVPEVDVDPAPADEPLVPRPHSIAIAAAGTAQLVELGGQPPPRCRTWPALVAGLLEAAAVAEALTGEFAVPAGVDDMLLPGGDARIEVARTGRQLADWADYMGNCIAGPYYVDAATNGTAALVALRAPDGRILLNADLRPAPHGWRIDEVRGRFNQDPDPELLARLRSWTAGLPLPRPAPPVLVPRRRGPRRRGSAPAARTLRGLAGPLGDAAASAVEAPETVRAAAVLGALAGGLVPLRRLSADGRVRAVRRAVDDLGLAALWAASGDRPLARAVGSLPAGDAEFLEPLLRDEPLRGALRPLARLDRVAPVRTIDLVGRRVRAALGDLIRDDAPELAARVRTEANVPFLRAAALAVTSWGGLRTGAVTAVAPRRRIRLPGFPASSLRDEGWLGAWPDATDLGADPDAFWPGIAVHGLLVPSSWLDTGWERLWQRAARH